MNNQITPIITVRMQVTQPDGTVVDYGIIADTSDTEQDKTISEEKE